MGRRLEGVCRCIRTPALGVRRCVASAAVADDGGDESTADEGAAAEGPSSGPVITDADRRRMQLLAAVPVGFALAAYAGQIFFAALIARAPLLLLSLNATDPILLGVAHQAPLWAFMAIGLTRLFITDPFLYRLGYDYGPNAKAYLSLAPSLAWRWCGGLPICSLDPSERSSGSSIATRSPSPWRCSCWLRCRLPAISAGTRPQSSVPSRQEQTTHSRRGLQWSSPASVLSLR